MTELELFLNQNKSLCNLNICELAYCIKNNKDCGCISCNICEFHKNPENILRVILSEHKEKPKLTDDEKAILRNVDPIYEYIVRNKYGDLVVYVDKPYKGECQWCNLTDIRLFSIFNHLFQFIKWEDEEPWFIPDLLEE